MIVPDFVWSTLVGAVVLLVGLILLKGLAKFSAVSALQKYVFAGIIAGEKLIIDGYNAVDNALADQNKKQVADALYDLLPDVFVIGVFPLPTKYVKLLIPREQWETLVKDAYDWAHALILRNEAFLLAQVETVTVTGALPPAVPPTPMVITPDMPVSSDSIGA